MATRRRTRTHRNSRWSMALTGHGASVLQTRRSAKEPVPSTPRRSPRPSTSRQQREKGKATSAWGFTNSVRKPESCASLHRARNGPPSFLPHPVASIFSLLLSGRKPSKQRSDNRAPLRSARSPTCIEMDSRYHRAVHLYLLVVSVGIVFLPSTLAADESQEEQGV